MNSNARMDRVYRSHSIVILDNIAPIIPTKLIVTNLDAVRYILNSYNRKSISSKSNR